MRTKCACNEGVATLIVSPYSKDKSGGVCGWANKHAKTSHGVSQDEGGGGGPALCNRLTPCFCWHGCLRVPGSTQTEEPGCPTTTHIWVRRCRLGRTVGRYAFSSHQARAHAFSRPAARARASCMQILHANSGCRLDQIMHKFVTPTQGVTENAVRVCKKLKDI